MEKNAQSIIHMAYALFVFTISATVCICIANAVILPMFADASNLLASVNWHAIQIAFQEATRWALLILMFFWMMSTIFNTGKKKPVIQQTVDQKPAEG